MKRMIVYVKRLFSLYLNPPATWSDSDSGFEPIPHVHYVTGPDEPSMFGDGPEGLNRNWLAWYMRNNTNKGYMAAIADGNQIKLGLGHEAPRIYSFRYLPPILVGPSKLISLEWVIWYRYEFEVTLEEAHQIAINITGKENGQSSPAE